MNDETPESQNQQLVLLSNFLTYRISRLHGKLNAQASRILKRTVGITLNQWRMLASIGGAETVTASELIRYTAMDKGLVSRNVRSLIELGLARSRRATSDSRVHLLSLTAEGKKIFDQALPNMMQRQAFLESRVDPEDLAAFRRVMDVLELAADDPVI